MLLIVIKCLVLLLITSHGCCVAKVVKVSNSNELKVALNDAVPGDSITLSGNTSYIGTFVASSSGSRSAPITILTENFDKTLHAKIVGENRDSMSAALTISGDYYILENIKIVHNNSLGLLVEGTDVSIVGALIQKAQKAVRINGARSYVKDCSISEVEQGIQVDADFSVIRDTFVVGEGIQSLVAEKKTCCGTVMGNVFDGQVDIKGTDYNLFDNVIDGKAQ